MAGKSNKKENDHHISAEKIFHFNCGACKKWWSIADAPVSRKKGYCPWCGVGTPTKKQKQSKKDA